MNLRNLAIWGVIVFALIAVYTLMTNGARSAAAAPIPYSQLLSRIDSGDIKSANIHTPEVEAEDRQGQSFKTIGPEDTQDLERRLEAHGAAITFQPPGPGLIGLILQSVLPIVLMIGAWIFIMRQMQGAPKARWGSASRRRGC